ncbi:MAG: SusD/RagB family nutrient-binding outer membrane lipoprotein, partial [Eubacteriaceae bacterium]|nr:SusD/RagB family nutrient-binding outer membrane lipoprotein [Eubacteriaceae bacterium]
MKKYIVNLILIISTNFMITGCDNYLDVNTPSGVQDESTLEMKDIISPVMKNTVLANYYATTVFSNYAQNFGSYGYGASGLSSLGSTWNIIYTDILPNINVLETKAAEKGALHYGAVIKILEAINISFAVECWGDVPYSQTSDPVNYPYPALDDGETVYNQALTLL